MMKYKYKVLIVSNTQKKIEKAMNILGKNGYVVTIYPNPSNIKELIITGVLVYS